MDLRAARTFLFVPAARPDRFEKAAASGADVVVLDLEDAVAPDDKDASRASAEEWLAAGGSAMVRINSTEAPWYASDAAMAARAGCPVMLPKVAPASRCGSWSRAWDPAPALCRWSARCLASCTSPSAASTSARS